MILCANCDSRKCLSAKSAKECYVFPRKKNQEYQLSDAGEFWIRKEKVAPATSGKQ